MNKTIDPMVRNGSYDYIAGSKVLLINLKIENVQPFRYDETYRIKGMHYQLHIKDDDRGTQADIILTEKELQSSNVLQHIFQKYEACVPEFSYYVNDSLEHNEVANRIRKLIREKAKRVVCSSVPFYGGWFLAGNQLMYSKPKTDQLRSIARNNLSQFQMCVDIPGNGVFLYAKNLRFLCESLCEGFEKILNKDTRVFLFLYWHYCYMSELFKGVVQERLLCIDIQDPYFRQEFIQTFFCWNQEARYEIETNTTTKKKFETSYLQTKDVPFIVVENPTPGRNTFRSKVEGLQKLIWEQSVLGNQVPKAVPLLFPCTMHDYPGLLHISIGREDMSEVFLRTLPIDNYAYFKTICGWITWNCVFGCLNENMKKFSENKRDSLYVVFSTIFSLLQDCYSKAGLHIEQMLGLDEKIENFLDRYLPQISSIPRLKVDLLLDNVRELVADGKIKKYERLAQDIEKCIPQKVLDEAPCILTDESCWGMNDAAFRLILNHIPRAPGRITALRLLDEANVLSEARVNRFSYLNKLSVRTREGQTVTANLVALKADLFYEPEDRKPIELLPDHRYFLMGTEADSAEPVYWDFDDAKNDNRHMLITGRSGVGKSYLLEKLLQQAAREKITTVIFHSQGELPNILGSDVIDVEREKPGISFVTGEVRKDARKAANLLQKALRLRDTQKNTLQRVYERYLNQAENPTLLGFVRVFKQVADEMELSNSASVRDRLSVFVDAQSFSGEVIDWSAYKGRTLILDFRDCTDDELLFHALTELFLQDLYAYKKTQSAYPTIVVVDEFQVFNTRDGAALATVLREGRKYGWSLWLASQLAESGAGNSLKNLASQAFVQVYFSHGAKGNRRIANMIGTTNQEQRQAFASLQELGVGDFLIQQGVCIRRCRGEA